MLNISESGVISHGNEWKKTHEKTLILISVHVAA